MPYPPTKDGVHALVTTYAKSLDTKHVPVCVQNMFDAKSFDIGLKNLDQNIGDFLDWLIPPLNKLYEDEIGWLNTDGEMTPWFAPANNAATLVNAIKLVCPALTVESDFGLLASTIKRFYNNTRDRKLALGIEPKPIGKVIHIISISIFNLVERLQF